MTEVRLLDYLEETLTRGVNEYLSTPFEERTLTSIRETVDVAIEWLHGLTAVQYKQLIIEAAGHQRQGLLFLAGAVKYLRDTGVDAKIAAVLYPGTTPEDPVPKVNWRIHIHDRRDVGGESAPDQEGQAQGQAGSEAVAENGQQDQRASQT